MGNAKALPVGPENIGAHFTNSAIIFDDVGWLHNQIPTHYLSVEFYSPRRVRSSKKSHRLVDTLGVAAGAVQGYFGGWTDLLFQRFMEVWSGLPVLYLLIILASIVEPNFWWLLGLMLLFSWMALVGVVRAEFLRARNFEFVRAARALGEARYAQLR